MNLYFLALCVFVIGAIASVFIKPELKAKFCTILMGLGTIFLSIPSLCVLIQNESLKTSFYLFPFFGNIDFVLDPLSAFFVLVISIMSLLGLFYSIGYIKSYQNKNNLSSHYFSLMALIASMLAVVVVQNALLFLIVWEIMSLSSFFLVIFENDKKETLSAGIKYLIYMHICVIFLMGAFALCIIQTQSLNFSDFQNIIFDNNIKNIAFVLFFLGFGTKAGFLPFHNWLPDAHPTAPSHISGIMSGIMIKTGIYGILRAIDFIITPTKFIAYFVLIVAIISALWGVLYAISQHDIKRLLAYHSLENIGIIGIGIGIGLLGLCYNNNIVALLGFSGGILHILNHSIFKMLLFFASGNIYLKTHIRDIEKMGGLIKKMPLTSALFLIGAVAICGLPPLNGFISEFLIYAGMVITLPTHDLASFMAIIIALSALALIGTMAILCFTKAFGVMFLGEARSEEVRNIQGREEKTTTIPLIVMAILIFLIGLFPQHFIILVLSPSIELLKMSPDVAILNHTLEFMRVISILFLGFVCLIGVLYVVKHILTKNTKTHNTWGCGYDRINERMQYGASSYADLFITTLKPLFKRIPHIKKPKEIFPKSAYYEMEIEDIEEAYVVKPLIKLDEKILSKFERIQDGNMQHYILFGLIFLIISIIGLIFIG